MHSLGHLQKRTPPVKAGFVFCKTAVVSRMEVIFVHSDQELSALKTWNWYLTSKDIRLLTKQILPNAEPVFKV